MKWWCLVGFVGRTAELRALGEWLARPLTGDVHALTYAVCGQEEVTDLPRRGDRHHQRGHPRPDLIG